MLSFHLYSQVSINTDATPPDGSAMLDVKSTVSGFLPPRMTQAQRNAISSPATGLLIWQTDNTAGYYYFNGTGWIFLGVSDGGSGHVIDCDGNSYTTVRIGGQEWMAENLRTTHYRNGEAIPNVTNTAAWEALTTGAWCWYNNDQATYAKYGPLYNWFTVNDSCGLCPQGWHVPTDAEWTALTTYLGGTGVAGGRMKTGVLWNSPDAAATNSSGFSGLPGGLRYGTGPFYGIGTLGYWWSSTENSSSDSWALYLNFSYGDVHFYNNNKQYGNSVRCLRD